MKKELNTREVWGSAHRSFEFVRSFWIGRQASFTSPDAEANLAFIMVTKIDPNLLWPGLAKAIGRLRL